MNSSRRPESPTARSRDSDRDREGNGCGFLHHDGTGTAVRSHGVGRELTARSVGMRMKMAIPCMGVGGRRNKGRVDIRWVC